MPNRILKESICTSETLDGLSVQAEMFFYRLLVQADDYGRMDARPTVLRARCFPLRLEVVQERHIKKWLAELAEAGLVCQYQINGAPFVQFVTWSTHQQIRNLRAKYPAPPEGVAGPREHPLPVERDVEDLICEHLAQVSELDGERIQSVDRQVRIGESYLDVVLKTETKTLVLEIKRVRLSNKATEQLVKYLGQTAARGALIGNGLSADFNLERCRQADIAVLAYDDNMGFDVILPSSLVTGREILGFPGITRDALIQSNPNQNPNPNPNPTSSGLPASPAEGDSPPSSRREILKALETQFAKLSGLELPPRETESQKREANRRWWEPLWEMYRLAGGFEKAKTLLATAMAEMDQRKLTVASPKSIQAVATAIHAQDARGNGAAPQGRQPVWKTPERLAEDPAQAAQLARIVEAEKARVASEQATNAPGR